MQRLKRGMWLYTRESLSPYAIGPSPVEVGNWCRLHCVGRVYAGASPRAVASEEWLAYFRMLRRAVGPAELFATYGLPEWADAGGDAAHPQYRKAAEWTRAALALLDETGQRLFAGVMLNVEPGWRLAASREQMAAWVAMHEQVLGEARAAPESAARPEAWFCLTWNLDRQSLDGEPLDRALLRASDGCAFMTYRNTPPKLKAVSAACLASAAAIGRPVRLTVECDKAGEGPGVDFSRSSRQRLGEITTALMGDLGSRHPHLQAIDIHHYDAWRALPPGDRVAEDRCE